MACDALPSARALVRVAGVVLPDVGIGDWTAGKPVLYGALWPCDCAFAQSNGARELPLLHHRIETGPAQAGHMFDVGTSEVALRHPQSFSA